MTKKNFAIFFLKFFKTPAYKQIFFTLVIFLFVSGDVGLAFYGIPCCRSSFCRWKCGGLSMRRREDPDPKSSRQLGTEKFFVLFSRLF